MEKEIDNWSAFREKDKQNRSDENENDPEEWHCQGGSTAVERNDALSEERIETKMLTISATQEQE
jgi:hypothetical protein